MSTFQAIHVDPRSPFSHSPVTRARHLATSGGVPFRAPHHTCTGAALLAEALAAVGGVLLLDCLGEWQLAALRQLRTALVAMPATHRPVVVTIGTGGPGAEVLNAVAALVLDGEPDTCDVYRCRGCGSDQVQTTAWIHPNQGGALVDEVGCNSPLTDGEPGGSYCETCGQNEGVVFPGETVSLACRLRWARIAADQARLDSGRPSSDYDDAAEAKVADAMDEDEAGPRRTFTRV